MLADIKRTAIRSFLRKKDHGEPSDAYDKISSDAFSAFSGKFSEGHLPSNKKEDDDDADEECNKQEGNDAASKKEESTRPTLAKKSSSRGRGLGGNSSKRCLRVRVVRRGDSSLSPVRKQSSKRNLFAKEKEGTDQARTLDRPASARWLGEKSSSCNRLVLHGRHLGPKSSSCFNLGTAAPRDLSPTQQRDLNSAVPVRTLGRKTFSSRRLLVKEGRPQSAGTTTTATTAAPPVSSTDSKNETTATAETSRPTRGLGGRKTCSSRRLQAKESRMRSPARTRTGESLLSSGEKPPQQEENSDNNNNNNKKHGTKSSAQARTRSRPRPTMERKTSSRRLIPKQRPHVERKSSSSRQMRSASRPKSRPRPGMEKKSSSRRLESPTRRQVQVLSPERLG